MGLDVSVGDLVQLSEGEDEDTVADFVADFSRLGAALAAAGYPGFAEPRELPPAALYSSRIGPYATLHYLRRLGAHLWKHRVLPAPGGDLAADDPVLTECYTYLAGGGHGTGFDHLLNHSDCEGYYVPVEFQRVIVPAAEFCIAGGQIGSSQVLLGECASLAQALELPVDLDPDSDAVWAAAEEQGTSPVKWRRYGIESRVCLVLHEAARLSVQYGSAICFG